MMKSSPTLISKIIDFEGCRLTSYRCPAGVPTIGIGHTKGVKMGQRITEQKALEFLNEDLAPCEDYVNKLKVCTTQGQFDALVDFVFNLGSGNLSRSTLLKKIRQGAPENEIRHQFMSWVYANKKKMPGLVKRRAWEADRFFSK